MRVHDTGTTVRFARSVPATMRRYFGLLVPIHSARHCHGWMMAYYGLLTGTQ
jgi:hypothetical protein